MERIRAEIDQLVADSSCDLGDVVEDVARLRARLLLQTALQAEVTAFLGRDRYQRDPDASPGHQPITVKTTSGPLALEPPKLRGTDQRFASALLGAHVTRTNALEALVIAGFVGGLSTRDVEATLAEALGAQAALSAPRSAGSVRRSARGSPPGRRAAWPRWSWTSCTWTAPAFDVTRRPRRAGPGRLRHDHHRQPGLPRADTSRQPRPRPMGKPSSAT